MTARPKRDRHGRIPYPWVLILCPTCQQLFVKTKSTHNFCSSKCWRPPARPPEEFWARVDKSGECWVWLGRTNNRGYGKFQATYAHRYSWMLAHGSLPPDDLDVLHRCDNRPCVRPDHLFLGDQQDNSDDMVAKGRAATGERSGARKHPERYRRGSSIPWAKLTESQIPIIRQRLRSGDSSAQIAIDCSVNKTTIAAIKYGKAWKSVAGDYQEAMRKAGV